MTDPFAAPAVIPATFPSAASFRGRLVLISPRVKDRVPNQNGAPGAMQDRITADISVVDGQGPVPLFTRNVPTGQFLEGPEFTGVYLSQEVIVKQLDEALRSGGMVLGRIDTKTPGTAPGKGNAWGLVDPTDQDRQIARNYLAHRTVGAAQAPAAAPVQSTQPVPAAAPAGPHTYAQTPTVEAPAGQFTTIAPAAAQPNPAAGNPFA